MTENSHSKVKISFLIGAYNAGHTIRKTLTSIVQPQSGIPNNWDIEILVVDDASPDGQRIEAVCTDFERVRFFRHKKNQGAWGARRTALDNSKGDYCLVFDADDWLVENWPEKFSKILAEWPQDYQMIRTPAKNIRGEFTVVQPNYQGPISVEDWLSERYSGEYETIYKGDFIRANPFPVFEGCDHYNFTIHLNFLRLGKAYIINQQIRIYDDEQPNSLGKNRNDVTKAMHLAGVCREVLENYSEILEEKYPHIYGNWLLKYSIYMWLAQQNGYMKPLIKSIKYVPKKLLIGTICTIILGRKFYSFAIKKAKDWKIVKKYG